MLKWINKYIEENKETWDDLELVKIQENFERQEQEKKIERIQLVKSKKRKFEAEPENEPVSPETPQKCEITDNETKNNSENWTTWRENRKEFTKEITSTTIADKITTTTTPKEMKTQITIKLKQPTLLETMKKTTNPEITAENEKQQLEKNIKKEKLKEKHKTSENKTKTNNKNNNQTQQHLMTNKNTKIEAKLRQPVLKLETQKTTKEEPLSKTKTKVTEITQRKITTFLKDKTTSQEKQTPEKQRKQPVLSSKKISQKEKNKLKKEKESKENSQARGFWAKYAENRRKVKENCENDCQNPTPSSMAPDLNITEQAHCNREIRTPEKISCTPVQPDDRVLTHVVCESETSQVIQQLKQITPGSELKEEVI